MKIFIYPPIHYTDILQKMKTCILKADDNFNEICEGLRTQDIEKTDIPDGRGNGQIFQNRTQKKKIGLGKMEGLK